MFNGEVDDVTRRRKSLFSNTLVLPYFDALEAAKIGDPKKLDSLKHTLVLHGCHLEKAVFTSADLRKADLESVQLQGASLYAAQLQGVSLRVAQLQGASLGTAKLQDASLNFAQLQGARLDYAQLQGADLSGAWLQGALLYRLRLQGATFKGAQLQGASLQYAELQGASFEGAQLQGASLGRAAVWRTSFEGASLAAVFEDGLRENESALPNDEFAALKAYIMKEVPEGELRENALKRIEKLNPEIFGPEASEQETLEKVRADKAAYQKALAAQLKILVCSGDEFAPYIVHGNAIDQCILAAGRFALGLVESILAPGCPVSTALTEGEKAAAKWLAKEAQPSESKQ